MPFRSPCCSAGPADPPALEGVLAGIAHLPAHEGLRPGAAPEPVRNERLGSLPPGPPFPLA